MVMMVIHVLFVFLRNNMIYNLHSVDEIRIFILFYLKY